MLCPCRTRFDRLTAELDHGFTTLIANEQVSVELGTGLYQPREAPGILGPPPDAILLSIQLIRKRPTVSAA